IMEEQERSYAALGIWMANAGVVFKFPHSFGRVVPYGMAGAGLVRYQPSKDAPLPAEARRRFAESSLQHAAGMFGVGASIPLQRSDLLLSFELTNHMSKTPLRGEGAGETFELHGVPMVIDPEGDVSGENDVGVTSHVRLAIGLTLPLR
ncbi:MAG TPA: hypothetical protein VHG09_01790, partial [Longimicrobiales bacterium]|nr:hypothetical protein [Longimicrobiales bacterium]